MLNNVKKKSGSNQNVDFLPLRMLPRVERLCPLFNKSEIGDEFHLLLNHALSRELAQCFENHW